MTSKKEIWRNVPYYPGYDVSNKGRVRTWRTNSVHDIYRGTPVLRKIIKTNSKGYYKLILMKKGRRHHKTVHQLVASAFIMNPFNKRDINHKDGIKTNNETYNLEWCTQLENNNHAVKTGLRDTVLENHGMAKLTNSKVRIIKTIFKNKTMKGFQIAKYFKVTPGAISNIKTERVWKGVEI